MTKASPPLVPGVRMTGAENTTPAVGAGAGFITPVAGHAFWGPTATLDDEDRCIPLRYSASLPDDVLTQPESVETEFATVPSSPEVCVQHGQPHLQPVHG